MSIGPSIGSGGGSGGTSPETTYENTGLLLHYSFDSANGTQAGNVVPKFTYDGTLLSGSTSNIVTDGSGYLTEGPSGAAIFYVYPSSWPTKTGVVRNYVVTGRFTATASAGSYSPTIRVSWADSSNFLACRFYTDTSGNYRTDSYEWVAASAINNVSGAVKQMSGGGEFEFHVEEDGDQVRTFAKLWRDTSTGSVAYTQPGAISVYKLNRPNKGDARFSVNWEGTREVCKFRELKVWDRPA